MQCCNYHDPFLLLPNLLLASPLCHSPYIITVYVSAISLHHDIASTGIGRTPSIISLLHQESTSLLLQRFLPGEEVFHFIHWKITLTFHQYKTISEFYEIMNVLLKKLHTKVFVIKYMLLESPLWIKYVQHINFVSCNSMKRL